MKLIHKTKSFFSNLLLTVSLSVYSLGAYANGSGGGGSGLSSVKMPKPKTASDGSFFGDFFAFLSDGAKLSSAVISVVVFLVIASVWIGQFKKVQDTGKGWGELIAFFIVGILLVIAVYWGLARALEALTISW